jgi:SAM-dependent methyltransferase
VSWERVSWLAHTGLPIQDPITSEQLEIVVVRCALTGDELAVDLGCGAGELLSRIVDRCGCRGLGIDISELAIEHARRRAPQVEWRVADAHDHGVANEAAALVACVGATHAFGGVTPALDAIVPLVRRGGTIIVGEGYWRTPPTDDWLAALGAERDELSDRDALFAEVAAVGLKIDHVVDTSPADLDAYNSAWRANLEEHLRTHPDDEEVRAALDLADAWHRECSRYLGFALVVAIKD